METTKPKGPNPEGNPKGELQRDVGQDLSCSTSCFNANLTPPKRERLTEELQLYRGHGAALGAPNTAYSCRNWETNQATSQRIVNALLAISDVVQFTA